MAIKKKTAKKSSTRVTTKLRAPKGLTRQKLDEVAQEMVAPLQKLPKAELASLKKKYGKDIGKVAVHSVKDELVGHLGAAGYDSKLWEKACC